MLFPYLHSVTPYMHKVTPHFHTVTPYLHLLIHVLLFVFVAQRRLDVSPLPCGHFKAANDPHQICFFCRSMLPKVLPRYHHCQTVLYGSLGRPSDCTSCCSVPEAVKHTWYTTTPQGELPSVSP